MIYFKIKCLCRIEPLGILLLRLLSDDFDDIIRGIFINQVGSDLVPDLQFSYSCVHLKVRKHIYF